LFPGILHRGAERLDLDVGELAIHLLYFAQGLRLDDVARLWVDRARAARAALALPVLGAVAGLRLVDVALQRLDRVEDDRRAVLPAGMKTISASHFASFTRCMYAAQSGFCSGTRTLPTSLPPPSSNALLNPSSESCPGPKSLTSEYAVLYFFDAHWPSG